MHIHSKYSDDGEFTPLQIVDLCRQAGIKVMSITDHNCVKANAEAAKEAAKYGLEYISGIEIDCSFHGINLHVLGYGIAFDSLDFEILEENIAKQNVLASRERLRLIQQLGFEVSEAELDAVAGAGSRGSIWTGETFAEVLLGKPQYFDHQLLKPYRPGGLRSDNPYVNFYWDFCAQGKPCYVELQLPDLEQVISIIHKNKGVAVLAHPGLNLAGKFHLLNDLIPLGLDGIEACSSYHNEETIRELYQWGEANQLLITGGSDYHGKTKPAIFLGKYGRFTSDKRMEEILCSSGLLY
ncbi:MAG TPA: PHP domain-containing protein [Bacillota bacterium]